MRYLHTMVRVSDLQQSLRFYCDGLGMQEVRRSDHERGRFTLVFLAAAEDRREPAKPQATATDAREPQLELTYNWDPEDYAGGRNFGHLAYEVDNVYGTCEHLQGLGYTINRPPRDGRMAFVKSPDGISVELLQRGAALEPAEPWASMPNSGSW